MRIQAKRTPLELHGELSSDHFGIAVDNQAHIISILRDKLYSNKVQAVLREYGANALDAHKEAGKPNLPIRIKLPTRLNTKLTIRDFGPGIGPDEIYSVYTQYGKSTKRDSNDMIGALGIGCKSGFAYRESFQVTSYHQGTKRVYSANLDETDLGTMSLLYEGECGDETGIEITIDCRPDDVDQFREEAQKLYRHFDPQPEINIELPVQEFVATGTGWKIRRPDGIGALVVMGSVPYPVDLDALGKLPEALKNALMAPVNLYVPIGAVEITASREGLEYKSRTVDAIRTAVEFLIKELEAELKAKLDAAPTQWSAREVYNHATQTGALTFSGQRVDYRLVSSIMTRMCKWNDIDLRPNRWRPIMCDGYMEVRLLPANTDKTVGVKSTNPYLHLNTDYVVCLVDTGDAPVRRAVALQEAIRGSGKVTPRVLMVKFSKTSVGESAKAFKAWLDKHGINGIPVYKASDYKPSKKVRTVAKSDVSKRTHSVFKMKSNYANHRGVKSNNWDAVDADLQSGSGFWIEIHHFRPVKGKSPSDWLKRLADLGYDTSGIEIHGFKPKEAKNVGPKWIEFFDWAAAKAKELIEALPDGERMIKVLSANIGQKASVLYKNRADSLVALGLAEKHPIVACYRELVTFGLEKHGWSKDKLKTAQTLARIARLLDLDKYKTMTFDTNERVRQAVGNYPLLLDTRFTYVSAYAYNHQKTATPGALTDNKKTRGWINYILLLDKYGDKL